MTTVTTDDLKEIKEAIATFGKQLNDVEKNLTQKINDVEKNLTAKIYEIAGDVKATSGKIEQLDKRVTTQEFIDRAVFISIITLASGSVLTTIGTSAIRYFWDNPLFHP